MAITVGHILKELDRRNFASGIAALAEIAERHRDLVREALARAPRSAKVDVGILVATLAKEVLERAEEERRRNPPAPWKYAFVALMDGPQRDEFRRLVAANVEPNDAARRALADNIVSPRCILVEPDPKDGEAEPPRPRRGVRRIRRQQPAGTPAESVPPITEASPPARAKPRSSRVSRCPSRLFGIRAFDDGEDITPEPVDHFPPPWIIQVDADELDAA
jgi:hypothetical protein